MNSMERILATMAGKPTDRRAVSLTLSLYGARLTSCDLREYYTDPGAYARGQSAVRKMFQPDILLSPFALPLLGAAFGSGVRFFGDGVPNLTRPAITSVDELDRLEIPDVDRHPQLAYFRQAVRLMAADCGGECPIAAIALSPIDLPAMIMGIESWLETLLFDRQGTERILAITVPHFVQWANALLSDGATFCLLPLVFANPSIVPRKIAVEICVPAMREAFRQVNGPICLHASGIPLAPFLDLFADLPNVGAFVLHSKEDFAQARQKVGPDHVLLGNIDGPSLVARKRDEVLADCMTVLRDRRDDPRFILASSAADIDLDTPPETIHAFRQAVEEFSRREVA